jgi:hypothetical protein
MATLILAARRLTGSLSLAARRLRADLATPYTRTPSVAVPLVDFDDTALVGFDDTVLEDFA